MEEIKLPSAHQVGEAVDVDFQNSKYLKGCRVAAVMFIDNGRVVYDLWIPVGFDNCSTLIERVDSEFVVKPID